MRLTILALAAVLTLGACSQDAPAPGAADSPAPVTDAAQADSGPVVAATSFAYSPLPPDVNLTLPFHVRSDRYTTNKAGVQRRRAILELLGGDIASASAEVTQSLLAAGYRQLPVKDRGDGITRMGFVKQGSGRINVSLSGAVENPSNPSASAVMSLDWLIKSAAQADQAPVETTSNP